MGIRFGAPARIDLIMGSLVAMVLGLFVSRALLSMGMLVFAGSALAGEKGVVARFGRQPFLWLLTLLFVLPFASGLWSSDGSAWATVVRIKLPLLLLPLCAAGAWQLRRAQWQALWACVLVLTLAGCLWSVWQYAQNAAAINESYLRAKSLPTPFENDHVRFSWWVGVVAAACLWRGRLAPQANQKTVLFFCAFFFAFYLHLLAARTGLLCFYFLVVLFVGQAVWQGKRWAWAAGALLLSLTVLAYFLLPTFQNRLAYFFYDLQQLPTYLPGSNDGTRWLSLRGGWQLLLQHPLGVGAGDLPQAMAGWYRAAVPGMKASDQILPSNEWLLYGAATGWPGVALLTAALVFPFCLRLRQRLFWCGINAAALLSFLFDIGLEVQFGVFVYSFVVLCLYKYLSCPQHP